MVSGRAWSSMMMSTREGLSGWRFPPAIAAGAASAPQASSAPSTPRTSRRRRSITDLLLRAQSRSVSCRSPACSAVGGRPSTGRPPLGRFAKPRHPDLLGRPVPAPAALYVVAHLVLGPRGRAQLVERLDLEAGVPQQL